MKKQKYYTKDIDNQWVEIDSDIADKVIQQYVEQRYIGVLAISSFIIGFLLGILAYAL